MHSKNAKAATKAEKARFAALAELGCVVCRMDGRNGRGLAFCGPVEIHHLLDGGRRIGHAATVPLGMWHHRGMPPGDVTKDMATDYFGPSLANGSRPFHARYGTDAELLAYTNTLLASVGFKS